MSHYAYYERGLKGWTLVVYHDEPPGKSLYGQTPERKGPFEVPASMVDEDGSPRMGLIQKEFPKPEPDWFIKPKEKIEVIDIIDGYIEEPLPEWAAAQIPDGDTQLYVMQQLFTKDGSRHGNGTMVASFDSHGHKIYLVVTDANSWIRYELDELMSSYTPGKYILKDFPNPKSNDDFQLMLASL